MPYALIGLGTNLGDRRQQLDLAQQALAAAPGVALRRCSRYLETAPIGGPSGQGAFLNAAALVFTSLSPHALFATLQQIETTLGRQRSERWSARAIDLDLLLFDDVVLREAQLQIPHPWLVARRFVLVPAAEIAPDMRHPILRWTVARLAHHLLTASNRFAWTGAELPTGLSATVAAECGAERIADPCAAEMRAILHPSETQQLAWHRQRAASLRATAWNSSTPQALLSDFWLGDAPLRARQTLSQAEFSAASRELAAVDRDCVAPKLVLVVDTGPTPASQLTTAGLIAELVARQTSPFVEFQLHSPADLLREAAGAIAAMSSD